MEERRVRGLTLIEMVLVLGLLATLALQPLLGWQQQRQRILLEQESLDLLAFLARAQRLAAFTGSTIAIRREVQDGAQVCLRADILGANGSTDQARRQKTPLIFNPHNSTITQDSSAPDRLPIFRGLNGTALTSHLDLQSGPYQIRIFISGKGRLRRCSTRSNISTLGRCKS